ncbi:MAG: uridine kinase [Myxococcota bacterium]
MPESNRPSPLAHRQWPADPDAPLVVGIAGGSASGKTSIARALANDLDDVVLLEHDFYYRDLTHLSPAVREIQNYDHPDALETDLLVAHLQQLKAGEPISRLAYNYAEQRRIDDGATIEPAAVILVAGIMVLHEPTLRAEMDLRIFVDASASVRFQRRLERDQRERGASAAQIRRQFDATVQPMHERFVEPSRQYADLIVPFGYNPAAVAVLLRALSGRSGAP